jgi:pimeloyl-ACP methyl ester carboxylesterase
MQGTARRGLSFGMITAIALVASAILAGSFRSAKAQTGNALGSYLDVENGKIYYEECGTGDEALVLLHDGVVHSAVWNDVWPSLCKEFHTIRYDRRGYGRSPAATGLYAETDDLSALLRHLKVRRAMLVGSSHGGGLSIEFTLEHPNLVEQLVLVGAAVNGYPLFRSLLDSGSGYLGSGRSRQHCCGHRTNRKRQISHRRRSSRSTPENSRSLDGGTPGLHAQ